MSVAAREPLRLGVIGAGMVAQLAHLPAAAQCAGVQVVALADLDLDLARRVAARWGIARVHGSHQALLADAQVQAVLVVTHRHATAAIVGDALAAGRHVLAEKPLALDAVQARALARLAQQRGLCCAVGFMKRHDEGVAVARGVLARWRSSDAQGRLLAVRAHNFCARYVGTAGPFETAQVRPPVPAPQWPAGLPAAQQPAWDWLANVGLHSVNLLRHLLGDPPGDPLRLEHARHTDGAVTWLLRAGAVPVTLDIGRAATGRWEEGVQCLFERGAVTLGLNGLMQVGRCASVVVDTPPPQASRWQRDPDACERWSFVHQLQAFADHVAGADAGVLCRADDAVRDLELLHDAFGLPH